jgi:intracellular septation protein A
MERSALDAAEEARQAEQWRRNKPSLITDLALGALFFVVAKFTDLTTAALAGAAAGLALVVVQRFVKVDLLGGLALFGVVMLLLSAGFSLAFSDDWAVKMKSTALGLLSALLFGVDALFFSGRLLAARLARYMPHADVDTRRLGIGMAATGLVLALVNYAVARHSSTDIWLYYTSFGDMVVTLALVAFVIRFSRRR